MIVKDETGAPQLLKIKNKVLGAEIVTADVYVGKRLLDG